MLTARWPLFILLFFFNCAYAYDYSCVPASGTPTNIAPSFGSINITDVNNNTPGYTKENAASWDLGTKTAIKCDCPNNSTSSRFFSTITPLPIAETVGYETYYVINDYLQASVKVYMGGGVGTYVFIPWDHKSNAEGENILACEGKTDAGVTTGSKGVINLRIGRSFVGSSYFQNVHLFDMYASESSTAPLKTPYMSVYLSGVVTVPQNCIVNAGTQIPVELGAFYTGDFNTIGQKPDGYTPKTFNVPIKCNDLTATANLTLRIQGTSSSGFSDALQSDNPDVGVVITDSSGNIIRPNDSSSVIPFTLDSSNAANVTLHAYPVGTTGNTPAAGIFTTLAYLRMDFS